MGLHTCLRVRLSCSRRRCRMMNCLEARLGLPKVLMDVLSEVLRVVRLQGALFYNGEFSSPWSVYAAGSDALARHFGTESEHLIVYHLLTEGRASVRLDRGDRLNL